MANIEGLRGRRRILDWEIVDAIFDEGRPTLDALKARCPDVARRAKDLCMLKCIHF